MAMIDCSECGKSISDQASSCPACGAPNRAYRKPMSGFLIFVIIVVVLFVLFLIFGAVVGSTPEEKAKQQERDAIEYCKKQVTNPSLEPDAQRFASRTCDYMVDKFRVKYHDEP